MYARRGYNFVALALLFGRTLGTAAVVLPGGHTRLAFPGLLGAFGDHGSRCAERGTGTHGQDEDIVVFSQDDLAPATVLADRQIIWRPV